MLLEDNKDLTGIISNKRLSVPRQSYRPRGEFTLQEPKANNLMKSRNRQRIALTQTTEKNRVNVPVLDMDLTDLHAD